MNDDQSHDTAEPEGTLEDQAPARGDQQPADTEPESDAPPAFDATDADWESLGVAPDEAPDSPDGYGLCGCGDPQVDAVLEQMAIDGDDNLDAFAEFAHQLQLTHQQFSSLVAWYAGQTINNAPSWDGAAAAISDEPSKLVDQIEGFARAYLSPRTQSLIQQAPPSPALLAVLEDMAVLSGNAPWADRDDATPDDQGQPVMSRAEIHKLMASEGYRRGDRRVVQAVRAAFAKQTAAKAKGFKPR